MYHVSVYVPLSHSEAVKEAMFAAGGGASGGYDRCAWQTTGVLQFRPLPGSDPKRGEVGHDYYGDEIKIEMICQRKLIAKVIGALQEAHPYEAPPYAVLDLVTVSV